MATGKRKTRELSPEEQAQLDRQREERKAAREKARRETIAADPFSIVKEHVAIRPSKTAGWWFCDSCLNRFASAEQPEKCAVCGTGRVVLV